MKVHLNRKEVELVRSILGGQGPAWLFGSRVWGNPRPYSDLDLALERGPMELGGLEFLREKFDESSLPFRVDLSVLTDLPPEWRERILNEGVRLDDAMGTDP